MADKLRWVAVVDRFLGMRILGTFSTKEAALAAIADHEQGYVFEAIWKDSTNG